MDTFIISILLALVSGFISAIVTSMIFDMRMKTREVKNKPETPLPIKCIHGYLPHSFCPLRYGTFNCRGCIHNQNSILHKTK